MPVVSLKQPEPTDEDSVIAGLNLEEFDPLSSSFHSRRGGGASRALSAMNQAEEEDDEDGETTLMRSEFDTQSPPQLCEVDIIVKQVGAPGWLIHNYTVLVQRAF